MAANSTSMAYALKTLWPQKRVYNEAYKDNPFFAMVPKDTNFIGKNKVIGVRYSDTQGRSASFSTAQTNKGAHKGAAFTVTRVKDYALFSVDGETLEASKTDPGSLVSALDGESSSAMNNITRSMAIMQYRSGSGSRGQRGSQSSSTITLLNTVDIVNFEVGMTITAGPNDSSTSLRSGSGLITAVDRDAGTLTYSGTITSIADNDYLFVQGDESAQVSGLAAWLPWTAPTSGDNFFGVDRSADTVRLSGKRSDISGLTPVEGLLKATYALSKEGGRPTHFFCNYDNFVNIEHDLGSKVSYVDLQVGEIGFKALAINGPKGPVKVIPDMNCPPTLGYLLTLDTWKFSTLGEAPKFLGADGVGEILRETSSDSYEGRIGYYGNLTCEAPGMNAVCLMPT